MSNDFTTSAMRLENMIINVRPEDYELAKKFLLKREAHDIIEMLGL